MFFKTQKRKCYKFYLVCRKEQTCGLNCLQLYANLKYLWYKFNCFNHTDVNIFLLLKTYSNLHKRQTQSSIQLTSVSSTFRTRPSAKHRSSQEPTQTTDSHQRTDRSSESPRDYSNCKRTLRKRPCPFLSGHGQLRDQLTIVGIVDACDCYIVKYLRPCGC